MTIRKVDPIRDTLRELRKRAYDAACIRDDASVDHSYHEGREDAYLAAAAVLEKAMGRAEEADATMCGMVPELLDELERLRRFRAAVMELDEAQDETGPAKHNPWLCDGASAGCELCARYHAAAAAMDIARAEERAALAQVKP